MAYAISQAIATLSPGEKEAGIAFSVLGVLIFAYAGAAVLCMLWGQMNLLHQLRQARHPLCKGVLARAFSVNLAMTRFVFGTDPAPPPVDKARGFLRRAFLHSAIAFLAGILLMALVVLLLYFTGWGND